MSSDDEDFSVGDSDEENYGAPAPVPEKKKRKIEEETKKGKKKALGNSGNKSGKDVVVKIENNTGSPKKKSNKIKKVVAELVLTTNVPCSSRFPIRRTLLLLGNSGGALVQ